MFSSMSNRGRYDRCDGGDYPPNSRLFIVCEKSINEDQIRNEFMKFGTIEDVRIPLDHKSNEPKGVIYIQFSKTSEAAEALEEMNLKVLPNSQRPLKIMVAANRSDIQSSDYDEEQFKRVFIHTSKSVAEDQLLADFSRYGHIESIIIQRDKNTGLSRGFAYIKYRKFTEAANAIEQCARHYKPVFASPRSSRDKRRQETTFESSINNLAASSNMTTSLISMMDSRPNGFTKVNFMCCPYITKNHVAMIFDIIPGMTNCQFFVDLIQNYGKGTVTYSNPISAAYAVDKLNRFEYPPGMKIFVKPDNSQFLYDGNSEQGYQQIPNAFNNLRNAIASTSHGASPDLAQLAEAIAEASKLIKSVTGNAVNDNIPNSNDLNYCSAQLPPPQPLAHIDSFVAKRCFLVCKPSPPPITVLRDVFCRFGNLIDVYTLPNKTVGYARYADAYSADEAIKTLHGAEVCGIRMKVLEAEDEINPKRRRFD